MRGKTESVPHEIVGVALVVSGLRVASRTGQRVIGYSTTEAFGGDYTAHLFTFVLPISSFVSLHLWILEETPRVTDC